ncbi:hypothetical protein BVRB_4g081400 [Beta vulgaris subsp. vulgaris]|nr:hypothetical protein BVRB_4g081400 [Beta vulgaris subsp. vulgaris]
MSGRDKGKAKSLTTHSGHRHSHDRGVTISSRKARELLFRSTQSSSGAETEDVPKIPPLSVALPTPIMDIEAWRPHSPWRGNPMAGNDQEAGTYYDSEPEHSSTDAEEGHPSRGCKPRTYHGRFARSSDGASCNAEGSGSSRPGKRKGTEEDTSWLVRDARPGGPLDGSVIPSFRGHIAARVWAGEDERTMLKCHNREKTCSDFGSWDDVKSSCAELFGMERSAFLKAHWSGGGVFIDSLIERCSAPDRSPTHQFRGYMLTLLGATLFVDKSGNRVRPWPLSFLSCSPQDVSRGIDRLLSIRQALDQTNAMQPDWLPYGICPVFAYPRSTYYGWLRYLDIVEPYSPDRTLRQLGFIQEVPHHILEPESCYRPSAWDRYRVDFSFIAQRQTWDLFPRASQLMLGGLHKAPHPSMATDAYLQWYDAYSHRFMINPTELPDGGAESHYVEGLVPDQVLASMFGMMDPFLERDTSDLPDDFRALFEGLFGWYEAWNLTRGVDRRRRM